MGSSGLPWESTKSLVCFRAASIAASRSFIFLVCRREHSGRTTLVDIEFDGANFYAKAVFHGHIINLFNGSGMELVNNLCQIVFAIAVGFLLVTIFYRGGSLLPCILVHSAINTLGTFASDAGLTMEMRLLHLGALIAITVAYTLILTRTLPKKAKKIHK